MGRVVTFHTGWQDIAEPQDLLELKLAAGQSAVLLSAKIVQSANEDITFNEQLEIALKRGIGNTTGSGGGTATAFKHCTGDAAHGLTHAKSNNDTQAVAGGGSLEYIPDVFTVAAGVWEVTPTPEMQIRFMPGESIILSLDDTPSLGLHAAATLTLDISG